MDFPTAVRTCFSKYVDFTGRARRSELWWFVLFTFLANLVASILDRMLGTDFDGSTNGLIGTLVSLAVLLPSLAVGARRLHDTGRSGWWQLLVLIPIVGWIILIVWFAMDGERGANEYGPDPKSSESEGYPPVPPTGAPYHGQG